MPELDEVAVYGITAEQWLKFAAFHMRASGVMVALAEALREGDRARYHEALGEFQELAEAQDFRAGLLQARA